MRLSASSPRLSAALPSAVRASPSRSAPGPRLRTSDVVVIDPRLRCRTALDLQYRKNNRPTRATWKAVTVQRVDDGREVERSLSFSTDLAITAPVLSQLLRELGVEDVAVEPQPPPASAAAPTPHSLTDSPHPPPRQPSVGRFFLHPLAERRLRLQHIPGQQRRWLWTERIEDENRVPVYEADVPSHLHSVLQLIQQTAFHSGRSTHFLVPTHFPLHFSCPAILRRQIPVNRGAGVYLKLKWKATPAFGPRTRLEEEAREEQRSAGAVRERRLASEEGQGWDGGEERREGEEMDPLPVVMVQIRLEVKAGGREQQRQAGQLAVAWNLQELKRRVHDRLTQFYEGFFGRYQQCKLLDERWDQGVVTAAAQASDGRPRDVQDWVIRTDQVGGEVKEKDTDPAAAALLSTPTTVTVAAASP